MKRNIFVFSLAFILFSSFLSVESSFSFGGTSFHGIDDNIAPTEEMANKNSEEEKIDQAGGDD